MPAMRYFLAAGIMLLSACTAIPGGKMPPAAAPPPASPPAPVSTISPPSAAVAPVAVNSAALGIAPAGSLAALLSAAPGTGTDRLEAALSAFRLTCPSLLRREDASGLTQREDWQGACNAAANWDGNALSFFSTHFDAVRLGDGRAFVTGYYEPEIRASRKKAPGFETPVYRRPDDLVDVDLGLFSDDLKGKRIRGRVDGKNFIPYPEREEIEEGALSGRGLEIAYAADAVELFFLQIQGSGRLRFPDGSVMRIGYDGQNGRAYTGIGRLMKERGQLINGDASMQGLVGWLHANPDEGRQVMRENKSFIFFREITGPGPLGALGKPVTGRTSVAADPQFIPLGAPVLLSMDRDEPNGLWIAQDTGGAIKGANRFDTFWGAGDDAARIAGGMSARGQALILLPKGTTGRLTGPDE